MLFQSGFWRVFCKRVNLILASLAIDLFEIKDQEFSRMKFGVTIIQRALLGLDSVLLPLSISVR